MIMLLNGKSNISIRFNYKDIFETLPQFTNDKVLEILAQNKQAVRTLKSITI
jgi:hypothetical protein